MSSIKVFFQIGTNNGNDLFKELVIKNKPDYTLRDIYDEDGNDIIATLNL